MELVKDLWEEKDIPKFQKYFTTVFNFRKIEWSKNLLNTEIPVLAMKNREIIKLAKEIAKGNFNAGDKKVSKLIIEPNPLLIDEIKKYFVPIPSTLFLECKRIQTKQGWRVSKYPPLFIEWLHKQSYHQSQHLSLIHI